MTEKQLSQLKSLLEDSSLASELQKTSTELDEKILSAARAREASQVNNPKRAEFGLSFSMLATASLAIILTVGLFFGMSQMILPEESSMHISNGADLEQRQSFQKNSKVKDLITRPESVEMQDAPSKVSRDRILMEFSLPATNELIANVEFEFQQDRSDAQAAIDIAMFEISSMIELGSYDSARERYAMLLEDCHGCSLPTTLEALVLSAMPQTG